MNAFAANGDGTVSDAATGLVWSQADSGVGMNWPAALDYCEALSLGGSDAWRLPSVKELQSIVDYSRSPDATGSAAIDPLFGATPITNEGGQPDFAHYWSSTTHIGGVEPVQDAAYVAFGRALGNMEQFGGWIDVHGAGAQRSDPKISVSANQADGFGPQGDARRADNFARCVRGGDVIRVAGDDPSTLTLPIATAGPPSDAGTGEGGQGQPPNQGGNGQAGPPQEAIIACVGQAEGATCSFQTPNGMMSGVCSSGSGTLACGPGR